LLRYTNATIKERQQEILNTVYYGNHFLFGRDKLYQYCREKYPKEYPTRREVMEWFKTQKVWQLHHQPPPRRTAPLKVLTALEAKMYSVTKVIKESPNRLRQYNLHNMKG
jgi:hypothetical protein